MAIEYFDGFDDVSAAQLTFYWQSMYTNSGANTLNPSTSLGTIVTGRNSTKAIGLTQLGMGIAPPGGNQATRTVGAAFNFSSFGNTAGILFSLGDIVTSQICLVLNLNGTLAVYRGGPSATLLGTTTLAMKVGGYYYIEMTGTIDPSAGVVKVNVNNGTWLSLTSQNTRQTSNSYSNTVFVGGFGSGCIVAIDDCYIRDDNTMIGDCRVESIFPNGVGHSTQFTEGGSTINPNNYQQVNENLPGSDGDTSYVYANVSGVGFIDTYVYQSISSATGTIYAVMSCPVMRNDAGGLVSAESVYYIAGINYMGASNNIGSAYLGYPDIQVNNPNTSSPWTVSDVNGAQFGITRTA